MDSSPVTFIPEVSYEIRIKKITTYPQSTGFFGTKKPVEDEEVIYFRKITGELDIKKITEATEGSTK